MSTAVILSLFAEPPESLEYLSTRYCPAVKFTVPVEVPVPVTVPDTFVRFAIDATSYTPEYPVCCAGEDDVLYNRPPS